MTRGFQATLPGSRSYNPAAKPQESFLETAWNFNKWGGGAAAERRGRGGGLAARTPPPPRAGA